MRKRFKMRHWLFTIISKNYKIKFHNLATRHKALGILGVFQYFQKERIQTLTNPENRTKKNEFWKHRLCRMHTSRESLISAHIFRSLVFFLLKHCHCTIINEVVGFLLLIHEMSTMFQPVSNVLLFVLRAPVFAHFNINFVVTTSVHLPGSIFWHMHD